MGNDAKGQAVKWKYESEQEGNIEFYCREEISVAETLVSLTAVYEDKAPKNPLCTTGIPIYK